MVTGASLVVSDKGRWLWQQCERAGLGGEYRKVSLGGDLQAVTWGLGR